MLLLKQSLEALVSISEPSLKIRKSLAAFNKQPILPGGHKKGPDKNRDRVSYIKSHEKKRLYMIFTAIIKPLINCRKASH